MMISGDLNGIKISHELFTPEMVVPALSIHDYSQLSYKHHSLWAVMNDC